MFPEYAECNHGDISKVDWEQRRYETAKAIVAGQLASPIIEGVDPNPSMQDVCIWAVKFADALIAELKKGGEK